MDRFSRNDWQLSWHYQHETVCIEAWGTDSLRVRASMDEILPDLPGALPAQSPQTTPPPALRSAPRVGRLKMGRSGRQLIHRVSLVSTTAPPAGCCSPRAHRTRCMRRRAGFALTLAAPPGTSRSLFSPTRVKNSTGWVST